MNFFNEETINKRNARGDTALSFAIRNNHPEVVKLLLEHKADPGKDVNIREGDYHFRGNRYLHHAIIKNYPALAKTFFANGINITYFDQRFHHPNITNAVIYRNCPLFALYLVQKNLVYIQDENSFYQLLKILINEITHQYIAQDVDTDFQKEYLKYEVNDYVYKKDFGSPFVKFLFGDIDRPLYQAEKIAVAYCVHTPFEKLFDTIIKINAIHSRFSVEIVTMIMQFVMSEEGLFNTLPFYPIYEGSELSLAQQYLISGFCNFNEKRREELKVACDSVRNIVETSAAVPQESIVTTIRQRGP